MRTPHLALIAAVATALALPATASAATKTVYMGPPNSPTTDKLRKLDDEPTAFFRRTVTIHRGDKVKFVNAGFHNVDVPPKGAKPLALVQPTGKTASGFDDAAGAPFWFNGQAVLSFNPKLFTDSKSSTFNGSKRVYSALPPVRKSDSKTIKFTKTGTWTYHCDIHPGMDGKVVVRGKGKAIPSKRADRKALRRQLVKTLAATKRAIKKPSPKNTVTLGRASSYGSEVLAMFPSKLTVTQGTVVTFTMPAASREIHTATFGKDPAKKSNYLYPIAKSFEQPPLDPRATYPSDVTPVGLTKTTHGNGFWNSGVLDSFKSTPSPRSAKIRFDQKGTYVYWCLVHLNMKGTVVVK